VTGDAQLQVNLFNKGFSRLAPMRRLVAFLLAVSLCAATAVSLASCGGGEDAQLLPGATAQEITENLDLVKQYAEEGECVGAADAAAEVSTQVEALSGVDPKLKQALQRGAARLNEVIADCEESSTEAVEPPSEDTTESKEPPGQEKKAEKEREKEEKTEEKKEPPEPPTTPTETTPEEPVAPTESGGTGAPGGVSPGAPAPPGGE
jgi:outer membrane biosynthesis protein TonB